jgi:hypothetical protein
MTNPLTARLPCFVFQETYEETWEGGAREVR